MGAVSDPRMPAKECGTPDAQYSFSAWGKGVRFGVHFPMPLLRDRDEKAFFDEMHAAMLPVVERLYERMWSQCFANTVDDEGRPYPAEYRQLWPSPEDGTQSVQQCGSGGAEQRDCETDYKSGAQ
jgi:hypothetical protein